MDQKRLAHALRRIIDYNWNDELRDFEQYHKTDNGTHIFRVLVELDNWESGSTVKPEEYLNNVKRVHHQRPLKGSRKGVC